MVTKMGRPTEDPKTVQTRIRMTKGQADMLNACAEALNKTKTDVIVMGIEKVHAEINK